MLFELKGVWEQGRLRSSTCRTLGDTRLTWLSSRLWKSLANFISNLWRSNYQHSSCLPEFPGAHGIEDAWNAGVAESGVTIHWWTQVDSKVIKQVRVPRLADDTIESFEARIHEAEYKLYPEVIRELLDK